MMKSYCQLICLFAFMLTVPAHATGGLRCETAGDEPLQIALEFGHVPSAALFLAKLTENGEEVSVDATQWWMQEDEVRLALVSKIRHETALLMKAKWNPSTLSYDGSIWRNGRKLWVRCRED